MKTIVLFFCYVGFVGCAAMDMDMILPWNSVATMAAMSPYIQAWNAQNDGDRGRTVLRCIRQVASGGAIAGGWGFFAATAARNAQLPYIAKRAPLALFLASCTTSNALSVWNGENDPRKTELVGRLCILSRRRVSDSQADQASRSDTNEQHVDKAINPVCVPKVMDYDESSQIQQTSPMTIVVTITNPPPYLFGGVVCKPCSKAAGPFGALRQTERRCRNWL